MLLNIKKKIFEINKNQETQNNHKRTRFSLYTEYQSGLLKGKTLSVR